MRRCGICPSRMRRSFLCRAGTSCGFCGAGRGVVIDYVAIPNEALVAVVRALELAGVTAVTARLLTPEELAGIVRAVKGSATGAVVLGDGLDEDEVLRLAGVRA